MHLHALAVIRICGEDSVAKAAPASREGGLGFRALKWGYIEDYIGIIIWVIRGILGV